MQFTLLLLVVFVSATLATPYYLRRGPGGPGGRKPQGSSDDSFEELLGGDKPGSSEESSGKGREGPCERVMERCGVDVEDFGAKRSESDQQDADKDMKECKSLLDEELSELEAIKRRAMNGQVGEEDLKELEEGLEDCEMKMQLCGLPDEPVTRVLRRMMAETDEQDGSNKCKDFLENMPIQEEDNESQDSNDNDAGAKRELLRELIRKLYSKK